MARELFLCMTVQLDGCSFHGYKALRNDTAPQALDHIFFFALVVRPKCAQCASFDAFILKASFGGLNQSLHVHGGELCSMLQ